MKDSFPLNTGSSSLTFFVALGALHGFPFGLHHFLTLLTLRKKMRTAEKERDLLIFDSDILNILFYFINC